MGVAEANGDRHERSTDIRRNFVKATSQGD